MSEWEGSTGDKYCDWLIEKGYDPADEEEDRDCRREYRAEMAKKRAEAPVSESKAAKILNEMGGEDQGMLIDFEDEVDEADMIHRLNSILEPEQKVELFGELLRMVPLSTLRSIYQSTFGEAKQHTRNDQDMEDKASKAYDEWDKALDKWTDQ